MQRPTLDVALFNMEWAPAGNVLTRLDDVPNLPSGETLRGDQHTRWVHMDAAQQREQTRLSVSMLQNSKMALSKQRQ